MLGLECLTENGGVFAIHDWVTLIAIFHNLAKENSRTWIHDQVVCVWCGLDVIYVIFLLSNYGKRQSEFVFIDTNFIPIGKESLWNTRRRGYVLPTPNLSKHNQDICNRITDACNNLDYSFGMPMNHCWNEDFFFKGMLVCCEACRIYIHNYQSVLNLYFLQNLWLSFLEALIIDLKWRRLMEHSIPKPSSQKK